MKCNPIQLDYLLIYFLGFNTINLMHLDCHRDKIIIYILAYFSSPVNFFPPVNPDLNVFTLGYNYLEDWPSNCFTVSLPELWRNLKAGALNVSINVSDW